MAQIVAVWLALTLGMILFAEAGYRLGERFVKDDPNTAQAATLITTTTLSLMGLLVAFTFGMATTRYDQRRDLVVAEANAISTAYLRQQLLPEDVRAELEPLMRDYAATRRLVVTDEARDPAVAAAQRRTADLQARIWQATMRTMDTPRGLILAAPILQATNAMFDVAEARRAAIEARIPPRELRVLITLALGAAGSIGATLSTWRVRQLAKSSAMFALVALAMSLVHDLDTSNSGGIRTPMAALDRVIQQIARPGPTPGAPGSASPEGRR